jgi:carbon monoxide dehydrogenase subunit G
MAIRIEKTFQIAVPIERVWPFLSDPRKVVTCVPGAQLTEQVDESTYKGKISVKVGPSLTEYKGEVHIVRLDEAAHEMEILGKGQDVRGKGSATMKMTGRLKALAGAATEVTSVSELNVVGLLAQLGSRVIGEVSNIMFEEFTANLRQQLQQAPAEAPAENTAAPKPISGISVAFLTLWTAIIRFFRRAFGGAASS